MTDAERDRVLMQILQDVSEMKVKINSDYAALYGNGKPGLIEDVKNITARVLTLEVKDKENHRRTGLIAGVVGFIINAALALYAALKNHQ